MSVKHEPRGFLTPHAKWYVNAVLGKCLTQLAAGKKNVLLSRFLTPLAPWFQNAEPARFLTQPVAMSKRPVLAKFLTLHVSKYAALVM